MRVWNASDWLKQVSTNQKHHPELGSDSSLEGNFCTPRSFISRGNRWWRREYVSCFLRLNEHKFRSYIIISCNAFFCDVFPYTCNFQIFSILMSHRIFPYLKLEVNNPVLFSLWFRHCTPLFLFYYTLSPFPSYKPPPDNSCIHGSP